MATEQVPASAAEGGYACSKRYTPTATQAACTTRSTKPARAEPDARRYSYGYSMAIPPMSRIVSHTCGLWAPIADRRKELAPV